MNAKTIAFAAAIWIVALQFAMAAPTFTVGYAPSPVLAPGVGHLWRISISPDNRLYQGTSDVLDIDVGFQLSSDIGELLLSKPTSGISGYSGFGDEQPNDQGEYVGAQRGADASNAMIAVKYESFRIQTPTDLEVLVLDNTPLSIHHLTSTFTWGGAYDRDGLLVDATVDGVQEGTRGIVSQRVPGSAPVTISVAGTGTYTATRGDVNLRDGVSLEDFKYVLDLWGRGTTWREGNMDGSAVTSLGDYNLVLDNFGARSGQVVFSQPPSTLLRIGVSVPEPNTFCIISVLALLTLSVRAAGWL